MNDRVEIRREVKHEVERADAPDRDTIVSAVSDSLDVSEAAVNDELDRMDQEGFAYLSDGVVTLA